METFSRQMLHFYLTFCEDVVRIKPFNCVKEVFCSQCVLMMMKVLCCFTMERKMIGDM